MSNLARWNPFKFSRKKASEQKTEATEQAQLAPFFGWPMHRAMGSLLQDPFFKDPFFQSAGLDKWFGDFSPERFHPTVDVVDDETHIRVTAELPGMDREDVQLTVDEHGITIRGEKQNETERNEDGCYRTERSYGMFSRTIPLPRDIDRENAEASFEKGVLTVRLPKKENPEPESRKIEIKGG